MRSLLTLAFLLTASVCFADTEAEHCRRLAPNYNAQVESRLWDGTRVDLINTTTAFEVDFASKWAEGIGQALYYAQLTGKRPGLVLLTRKDEARFAYRAQTAGARAGVTVFIEWIDDVKPQDGGVDINIGPLNIHVPKGGDNPLVGDDAPALRAYMIQHKDGRWLRRTVPGQINTWIVDRGSASIWVNKQEAHRVWTSLAFGRDSAELKTFMLVPVKDE